MTESLNIKTLDRRYRRHRIKVAVKNTDLWPKALLRNTQYLHYITSNKTEGATGVPTSIVYLYINKLLSVFSYR